MVVSRKQWQWVWHRSLFQVILRTLFLGHLRGTTVLWECQGISLLKPKCLLDHPTWSETPSALGIRAESGNFLYYSDLPICRAFQLHAVKQLDRQDLDLHYCATTWLPIWNDCWKVWPLSPYLNDHCVIPLAMIEGLSKKLIQRSFKHFLHLMGS